MPAPPEKAPLRRAVRFVLKGVNLQGSSVLSDTDLSGVVQPYLGQTVTIEELLEIRRQITQLYIARGFINSGAVLPDQDIENGIVTMVAVEGGLTDVTFSGNKQLADGFLRQRVTRGLDEPLNVNELRENVQILLQRPDIRRLNAELGPGARPGESELNIEVEEQRRVEAHIGFSNNRPPSVGAEEGSVDLIVRNLTGWGDVTNLQFSKTEGLEDYFGSISIPVSPYDTVLGLSAQRTDSEVVEEPFSSIDVESESESFEISLRHPLWRTPSRELAVTASFARRRSQTFLLGVPFAFSEGVEPDGESVVAVPRLALDFIDRSQNRVIALRSTFSLGIDALGATNNPGNTADGEFFAWLGQIQYVQRVWGDFQFIFRADSQLTPHHLLPLEKFAIGGADSVRGYRENRFVRDNGVVLSLEGRIPLFRIPIPGISKEPGDGKLYLAPFFDYGRSWDNIGLDDEIYSVGAGLRWRVGDLLQANIYYGEDLKTIADVGEGDDLQDQGIHFEVTLSVFF